MIKYAGKEVYKKRILNYNENIINDNYEYAIIHGYSDEECEEYFDKAMEEQEKFNEYLIAHKNEEIEVVVDRETSLFRLKNGEKDEKAGGMVEPFFV